MSIMNKEMRHGSNELVCSRQCHKTWRGCIIFRRRKGRGEEEEKKVLLFEGVRVAIFMRFYILTKPGAKWRTASVKKKGSRKKGSKRLWRHNLWGKGKGDLEWQGDGYIKTYDVINLCERGKKKKGKKGMAYIVIDVVTALGSTSLFSNDVIQFKTGWSRSWMVISHTLHSKRQPKRIQHSQRWFRPRRGIMSLSRTAGRGRPILWTDPEVAFTTRIRAWARAEVTVSSSSNSITIILDRTSSSPAPVVAERPITIVSLQTTTTHNSHRPHSRTVCLFQALDLFTFRPKG